jgi:hypothetical protein
MPIWFLGGSLPNQLKVVIPKKNEGWLTVSEKGRVICLSAINAGEPRRSADKTNGLIAKRSGIFMINILKIPVLNHCVCLRSALLYQQ